MSLGSMKSRGGRLALTVLYILSVVWSVLPAQQMEMVNDSSHQTRKYRQSYRKSLILCQISIVRVKRRPLRELWILGQHRPGLEYEYKCGFAAHLATIFAYHLVFLSFNLPQKISSLERESTQNQVGNLQRGGLERRIGWNSLIQDLKWGVDGIYQVACVKCRKKNWKRLREWNMCKGTLTRRSTSSDRTANSPSMEI